jgi:hypothetical protein
MSDESGTPLRDAFQQLGSEPITTSAELGLVADGSRGIGVAGALSTTLPKGWALNGEGRWQHKTGWSIAATARWTKGK